MYTDQIACAHSEACYAEGPAHATNASSWAAGSEALLQAMARKMGPGKVLISESQDESKMGGLHAFLSIYGWLGKIQCQTVLAWQAVYGGWSVNVGDIRYPRQPTTRDANGTLSFNSTEAAAHRAINAQLFVAGGVMGWYSPSACPDSCTPWLNTLGLPSTDLAYARLLASTKVNASKYLTHGRLWRQPEWGVPVETMQLHDYGYMEHRWNQSCPTPKVLAETWLANDGTFAVVATNHGESELVLNVTVDLSAAGSLEAKHSARLVRAMPGRSVAVLPVALASPQASSNGAKG